MTATTTTVPVLSLQQLMELSREHDAYIAEIKQEVAQEIDNQENTTPLFDQLANG
jgi:hypothetical protein